MPAYDPKREELVDLCGSAPDPTDTGLIGKSSTVNLQRAALGHPQVRYGDFVLELDVYTADVEGGLEVHLYCPSCRNMLRITSDRKAMQYEPGQPVFDAQLQRMVVRGVIDIEPFGCTWEKPDADGSRDRRVEFGINLCRWRVGISRNVARDD